MRELQLVDEINGACSPLLRLVPVPDPPSNDPAIPLQVRAPLCACWRLEMGRHACSCVFDGAPHDI